jgi:hypothetical protein
MDVQAAKQRFVALEEFLQGVEKEALAEAARTREEVITGGLRQTPGRRCLVDIVILALADLGEGLDADGELATGLGHAVCSE